MNDDIKFRCPHCSKWLNVPAKLAGRKSRCPNPACGETVEVPQPRSEDDDNASDEPTEPRRSTPWGLIGAASAAALVAVCFLGLFLKSRADASDLRKREAAVTEENARIAEELRNERAVAKRGGDDVTQLRTELATLKKKAERMTAAEEQLDALKTNASEQKVRVAALTKELADTQKERDDVKKTLADKIAAAVAARTPPKIVTEFKMNGVLNAKERRLAVTSIEDVFFQDPVPARNVDTFQIVGVVNNKGETTDAQGAKVEHKVDGKSAVTTTGLVEVPGKDGKNYKLFLKDGHLRALSRVVPGEPDHLLYVRIP